MTTSTSGLSASIARFGRVDLRRAERVERVRDLPLQVRLVDDVGVDDPDRADAGRSEVERRRRAEAAGADQEDPRVEQLQLALLADLGDQQVARVAGALLRRERARQHDLAAVALPVGDAADERVNVLVAELLERLGGEGRAVADGAVEDDGARGRARPPRCATRDSRAARGRRRGCAPPAIRPPRGRRPRGRRAAPGRRGVDLGDLGARGCSSSR